MITDLKSAFRQFIKSPGFTAVAVIILALGIGVNAAVFTVIDTLLLRGLPVRHPEELVVATLPRLHFGASYPLYQAARRGAKTFSGFVGFATASHSIAATGVGRTGVTSASVSLVSGDFFSFLNVPPALGRALAPTDDKTGAAHTVAVLSDAYWKRAFGADPGVIGKTVLVDNVPISVVGVAPAGFCGVEVGIPADLWIPLEADPILAPGDSVRFNDATAGDHFWIHLLGRVRPGTALSAANAELAVIYRTEFLREGASAQALRSLPSPTLSPAGSGYVANRGTVASLLNMLLLIVGMVLVIACANVAGLLLARSAARQKEFALRAALGAARRHLTRQLLVESMMLAAPAGALGLLLSHWGTFCLARYLPAGDTVSPTIDGRILAFAVAASVGTGVLVGLLPIARLGRLAIIDTIKSQAGTLAGGSGNRLSHVLVASQIALSICLLAGSGLFIRTLQNLKNVDTGFDPSNLAATLVKFDNAYTTMQRITLAREVWLALQQTPGVSRATFSLAGGGFLSGGDRRQDAFIPEGYIRGHNEPPLEAHVTYAGPGFLTALGTPLYRGRDINFADVFPTQPGVLSSDVAVVNEAFVKKFYPHEDPLGRIVHVPGELGALS